MSGESSQVFVIVRAPNGDVREFPIGEAASVIGRDDSCDIRVDDRKVSRRHAAFRLIDGQPWAEDLGSVNGIKLNGKKVNGRALVLDGDVVQVGGYEVRLKPVTRSVVRSTRRKDSSPPPLDTVGMRVAPPDTARNKDDAGARLLLFGQTKPVAGRRFPLGFGESIVGRLEDCAVPILDGSVSRQHARIVLSADAATVTDLGSSNGTFVNDVRVDRAELTDGDRLKFGSVDFRVELSSEIPSRVGPLEPSVVGKAPSRPKKGGMGIVVAAAGVVVLGAVVALGGHRLGRWSIPGLPGGKPPALAGDPAPDPTPSASPEPLAVVDPPRPTAEPTPAATPAPTPDDPPPTPVAVETPPASPSAPAATPTPVATPAATPPASVAATPAATAAASPAASLAPVPSVAPAVALVRTATSPYGPRDEAGMPTDLPVVDVGFDFEGFVVAYLGRAAELEAAGRFVEMRAVIAELVARDPINVEARALRRRADVAEKAAQVLANGDELRAQGKLVRALEVYAAVPAETPQGQQAQARIAELRPVAVKRELERVDIELKRDKTWPNAQRRLCGILAVDPDNGEVRKMLEELDAEMRGKGLVPAVCGTASGDEDAAPAGDPGAAPGPGTSPAPTPGASPAPSGAPAPVVAKAEQIAERWPDRTLQRIVQSYAEGDLAGSIKRADLAAKKGKGPARTQAKALVTSLRRAQQKYERVRNEVSVNPSAAWAQLLELGRIEAEILPEGSKSFLVTELERTLADAFAERGAAAFEQERYDDAFTLWDAGFRLNSSNAKIQQGLVRLEQLAEKWVKEAELAAQRGQSDVCDRWRTITRMTRSTHDAHKRARARIQAGC